RPHLLLPTGNGSFEPRVEAARVGPVRLGVVGIEFGEPLGDSSDDAAGAPRIEPDVGVSARVHVAEGAVELVRHLEERSGEPDDLEVSRLAGLDPAVARTGQQGGKPARFQASAGVDEEVGAVEPEDEGGLPVDEVRVLVGRRQHLDRAVRAHHLARQGAERRQRGRHPYLRPARQGREEEGETGPQGDAHRRPPQKTWAPWEPITNWYCRKYSWIPRRSSGRKS